jgi:hypothetical protein
VISPFAEIKHLKILQSPCCKAIFWQVIEAGYEFEIFTTSELFKKPRTVRDISGILLTGQGLFCQGVAVDDHRTTVCLEQARKNLNGGGFASSVWPQKSKDLASLGRKTNLVDCCEVSKSFVQVGYFEDGFHGGLMTQNVYLYVTQRLERFLVELGYVVAACLP